VHPRTTVPPDLLTTARLQAGLIELDQCRAAGLSVKSVRGLVGRGSWRHVARRVWEIPSVAPSPTDHDARRRRSALLGLLTFGPEAVAVGPCALALHGLKGLPTSIRPEVALPGRSNRLDRDGVRVRQFDDGMEVVKVGGRRVVSLEWALAQAVPELPHRNGLALLDAALCSARLTPSGLARAHDIARGRRGIRSRHVLWDLADRRAESPLESFARWECVVDGIPPDTLQLPLTTPGGRAVARGDLAWRRSDGRWLVVEMDGTDVHGTPAAVYADRSRQNLLTTSASVVLLRFTGRDLGTIAPAVRRTLAA
jgi:hypothetical protein